MKKDKLFLTLLYKKEIETNDSIEWDCFYDIFGDGFDNGGDIYPEKISVRKNQNWAGNVDHIKIDNVIEILEKLKKSGCNYVEIMHHCDHNSYVFNGLEVKESTPEDIENELLKEKKRKEKLRRIEELEKEIKKISQE
jgi:hypothetical protein